MSKEFSRTVFGRGRKDTYNAAMGGIELELIEK